MAIGEFTILDDSGIIAVIDASRYQPFVGPNWTFDELLARFHEAMAEHSMLIWAPGCEGVWKVVADRGPPIGESFRSAEGSIRVEREGLRIVSYEQLTMSAQFEDVPITSPAEPDNLIELPRGLYHCQVTQFNSPDAAEGEDLFEQEDPHFWLSFTPSEIALPAWPDVRWLTP